MKKDIFKIKKRIFSQLKNKCFRNLNFKKYSSQLREFFTKKLIGLHIDSNVKIAKPPPSTKKRKTPGIWGEIVFFRS